MIIQSRELLQNHNMPGLQIFKYIKQTYEIATFRNTRKWEFFARKESSTFEQLYFLHNCKRRNILPNSINYQPPIKTTLAQRIAQTNGRRMLNLLISDAHNRLRIYQQKLHGYRNSVIQNTSTADAKSLDNGIKYSTSTYKTRRRIELDKKYKNTRSHRQHQNNTNTRVKNISDKTLTDEQNLLLYLVKD